MIIVEGPDNCGKSTLIQKLIDRSQGLLVHGNKELHGPPKSLGEYMDRCEKMYSGSGLDKLTPVYDRCHLSEAIYGPALRGRMVFEPSDFRQLEKWLSAHDPLYIYCFRSVEKILETFGEREQLNGVQDNIEFIVRGYNITFRGDFDRLKRTLLYTIDHPFPDLQFDHLHAQVMGYLTSKRTW